MLKADQVWQALCRGSSAKMSDDGSAKFRVGEQVIAKSLATPRHIRLPEYVQGHKGKVFADRGSFVFPDDSSQGVTIPQRLYTIQFKGRDLWERVEDESSVSVYVDLFESYLERA